MSGKNKGMDNLINVAKLPPEQRKEFAMKGVEARRKKKEERMQLQACMKRLLALKSNKPKQKEIMKQFGFEDEDLTNQTLLMVALFQKGLTGDVGAIKEIVDMMDKLDMSRSGKTEQIVQINLVTQGQEYEQTEEVEKEIWDVEQNDDWMEEEATDEWETDVYRG